MYALLLGPFSIYSLSLPKLGVMDKEAGLIFGLIARCLLASFRVVPISREAVRLRCPRRPAGQNCPRN